MDEPLPQIVGLSFFSGAGGLDLGMERAGIPSVLYCESNHECRMTLHKNRPDAALLGDISSVTADQVRKLARIPEGREIDVMFGGPPCQAFSTAGARRAFDDERGNVFLRYLALARELQPKYLVIENVRGLLSTPFPVTKGGEPVRGGAMSKVIQELRRMGYGVSFNLYNAANYGANQIRERVILIAKRDGSQMPYIEPTHSNEPAWNLNPWRTFNEATKHLKDIEHTHSQFPERRLRYFEHLSEGQYWTSLPADMQESAMGKAFHLTGGRTGFYRRLNGNRPSPTLVTSPTMPATDLCHPSELRPLSVEEYKAIQGFPDDWWIAGSMAEGYRQIGNAVPVQLGEAIGRAILSDMQGDKIEADRWQGFPYSRYRRTSDKTWSVSETVAISRQNVTQ
ncbi:DNA cytosine methyltransferase [Arthrobacter psychrolactophilus]